jgi:hypothetical protein
MEDCEISIKSRVIGPYYNETIENYIEMKKKECVEYAD